MKNLHLLDEFRRPYRGVIGDETCGNFVIPYDNGRTLKKFHVIASSNMDWDHVSVSLLTGDESKLLGRCPTWDEMCYIKDLFFNEDEVVIQYHPAKSDYVNINPYVLHIWRPLTQEIPQPPTFMV